MTRDAGARRRLLVWDGPSMDLALSDVIGERASPATRPIMSEIYSWFAGRANGDEVEAAVFVTVPPGQETVMTPWIVSLRRAGFFVFMKPKLRRSDGVEPEMVAHIDKRLRQPGTREIIVAAHDPKHFEAPLRRVAAGGVAVRILGYRELDTIASSNETIGFIDLEDIAGAFASSLPRTNLHDLPATGRWLDPLEYPTASPSPSPSLSPEDDENASTAVLDLTDGTTRDEVIDFVRDAARCAPVLSVAEVGDALRAQYPACTLPQLGFSSISELLTAVTEDPEIQLQRDDQGGHQLAVGHGAEDADAAPADDRPMATESPNPIYAAFQSVSLDDQPR